MQSLGKALGTTVTKFNSAHRELKKVDKDILKITATTGITVQPIVLDKPSEDMVDVEE
jgi:hypothetical protein